MDQLSEYLLHTYPNNYFTGKDDCNLVIWGTKGVTRHAPKLFTLLIGFDYPPYEINENAIEAFLSTQLSNDLICLKLYEYGKSISERLGLPFLIIVYPSMRNEFNSRWEESRNVYDEENVCFYYKIVGQTEKGTVQGSSLRQVLYHNLGQDYHDTGTSKDKNKQIADYFHMWSRDCLSKNIAKFDIDGFLVDSSGDKKVLIEFKRSHQTPYIPEWYPKYDKPDYLLQFALASAIGAKFWLLHHELGTENELRNVSFFEITDVLENENNTFMRFSRRMHKIPLIGEVSLNTIINDFFSETNDDRGRIMCPICGRQVRSGQYGFYCCNKSNCKMTIGKVYGDCLSEDEIRTLVRGECILHHNTNTNRNYSVSPMLISYSYTPPNSQETISGFSWKVRQVD